MPGSAEQGIHSGALVAAVIFLIVLAGVVIIYSDLS